MGGCIPPPYNTISRGGPVGGLMSDLENTPDTARNVNPDPTTWVPTIDESLPAGPRPFGGVQCPEPDCGCRMENDFCNECYDEVVARLEDR